jgi:phosphomannomutase/phosphoglucomutase
MAKKKSAKADTAKQAKPAKVNAPKARKESNLLQQALPALVLLVVVLALVQGGSYLLASRGEQAQRSELVKVYRQHYVAALNSYVRNYEEVVKALPDGELLPYLQADATVDSGLLGRFPGALFARVAPLNLDPAVPNGLSFAHQDMVMRLASGKAATPEITFYEGGTVKAQVVTFARMLKDAEGKPGGILLLGFPFQPLEAELRRFAPEAGAIELLQKVGGEKASILKVGEGEPVPGADATTANPGWELHFAPAPGLGQTGSGPLLLALMLLAPLLGGGLLAWAVLALQKKVKQDVEAIDTFSENFLHYGNRERPSLHFSLFAPLLAHIDQYGAELRAGRNAVRKPQDNLGEINVAGEDESALFGSAPAAAHAPAPDPDATLLPQAPGLSREIFRAYDIRGVVGKGLSAAVAKSLGQAIGSEAKARGDDKVVVGRDGRLSGPELSAALIEGLRASGCDVIDVGMVPTPVLYFAAKTIANGSGVMVTGSHNPADYNGFKIMLAGDTLAGDDIQALRERIESKNFTAGEGGLSQLDVAQDYVDRISADIALARPLRVVVDGGNGAAGPIGVRALEAAGCEVTTLFCDVDGNFPNHHPDPSKPENLEDLIASVATNDADLGIAFDGDGDRIGVVTKTGKVIYPDRLMMLYAKHVLITNPGADIIFDVKCTRDLPALIASQGGRPVMCKTGHSFIKGKLKETGAALAGEMSGHIFFNDRWFGFDDAIYSAARLLEILSLENEDSDAVFAEFPENPSTPEINIPVPDESKFGFMEALKSRANFPDANVITLDGVRVEFAEGWGLVRASNTTPCLVARFEGRTPAALADVQAKFKALLSGVDASLQIPF